MNDVILWTAGTLVFGMSHVRFCVKTQTVSVYLQRVGSIPATSFVRFTIPNDTPSYAKLSSVV